MRQRQLTWRFDIPPVLILTDLGLPKIDGIEFVRRLRHLGKKYERIPVIMLTAFDRNHYYYSAAAAGVTAFLTKPVDFDTLETTIKKCMKENAFTPRSGSGANISKKMIHQTAVRDREAEKDNVRFEW